MATTNPSDGSFSYRDRAPAAAAEATEAETTVPTSVEPQAPSQEAPALPRQIPGGFLGVAADLDRHSRDWMMMVRLLEQQRLLLETAEQERGRLYAKLELAVPDVLATGRALEETIETTKGGDVSANLSALFQSNLRALDDLENTAKALTANLLWMRSSWEQYARSVIGAQKLREAVARGGPNPR